MRVVWTLLDYVAWLATGAIPIVGTYFWKATEDGVGGERRRLTAAGRRLLWATLIALVVSGILKTRALWQANNDREEGRQAKNQAIKDVESIKAGIQTIIERLPQNQRSALKEATEAAQDNPAVPAIVQGIAKADSDITHQSRSIVTVDKFYQAYWPPDSSYGRGSKKPTNWLLRVEYGTLSLNAAGSAVLTFQAAAGSVNGQCYAFTRGNGSSVSIALLNENEEQVGEIPQAAEAFVTSCCKYENVRAEIPADRLPAAIQDAKFIRLDLITEPHGVPCKE